MINLIIWLAAFLCPNPTHTVENHGNCYSTSSTSTPSDTGGETGGLPKPTTPPPPPPTQGL